MSVELTTEQVYATYKGETWYRSKTKQVFEISGPPGAGKSFLINFLLKPYILLYMNMKKLLQEMRMKKLFITKMVNLKK